MNKKTLIEWVKNPDGTQGETLNSKTGCLNHTPEGLCLGGMFPCYAYKLANGRLRTRYLANSILPSHDEPNHEAHHLDPFYPRFWPERLEQIRKRKKPTGYFLDDMSDWMGSYWPEEWTEAELQVMRDCPQHRFYTLTKQPQNLIKFSPYPPNCWVGVTATNPDLYLEARKYLRQIEATIKYISFEPLLAYTAVSAMGLNQATINWVIIGAQTKPYKPPEIEWVEEIVLAARKAGIAIFQKDNLKPLFKTHGAPYDFWYGVNGELRQEFPNG